MSALARSVLGWPGTPQDSPPAAGSASPAPTGGPGSGCHCGASSLPGSPHHARRPQTCPAPDGAAAASLKRGTCLTRSLPGVQGQGPGAAPLPLILGPPSEPPGLAQGKSYSIVSHGGESSGCPPFGLPSHCCLSPHCPPAPQNNLGEARASHREGTPQMAASLTSPGVTERTPGDSQLSATPPCLPQRAGQTPTWAARIGHVAQAEVIYTGHTVAVGSRGGHAVTKHGDARDQLSSPSNAHWAPALPCPCRWPQRGEGAGCQAPHCSPTWRGPISDPLFPGTADSAKGTHRPSCDPLRCLVVASPRPLSPDPHTPSSQLCPEWPGHGGSTGQSMWGTSLP